MSLDRQAHQAVMMYGWLTFITMCLVAFTIIGVSIAVTR